MGASVSTAKHLVICFQTYNTCKEPIQTRVGENGKKVSGGQRQRIGIARAVYSNKQIIILDEPTSSLDKETGNNILKTLKELSKFKTILISSHNNDLSNIADRVINLSGGEITFK